LNTVA